MIRFLFPLTALLVLLTGCGGSDSGDGSFAEDTSSAASSRVEVSIESEPVVDGSVDGQEAGSDEPSREPAAKIIKMAVPEGYTLARIGMLMEELSMCTIDEFITATQEGDFDAYPLVAQQLYDENRCFRLEGYLFPATYEIYSTDTPEAVIRRMLDHLERRISGELRDEIAASGFTFDEVLTLASIIEKEAFGHEQMPAISSVLHNRLEQGMPLQCDVTINYVEGAIKPFISGDVNRYNEYYNTYKCPALPAGAICNPSLDAIKAAIAPAETDYLYFVTDAGQNYYYSATWEGHLENIETAGIFAPPSGNGEDAPDPDEIEPDIPSSW